MAPTPLLKDPNGLRCAAALTALSAGYLLLGLAPAEGVCSATLAPLLLVLGYCVAVPWTILAWEARHGT